jgi:hypothetical protein
VVVVVKFMFECWVGGQCQLWVIVVVGVMRACVVLVFVDGGLSETILSEATASEIVLEAFSEVGLTLGNSPE